ncbi:MAG: MGMT family protein [Gemmatimonadota bacterium]|jgi:methylated-DNA-protein-cysteine methyltransferase-like protein
MAVDDGRGDDADGAPLPGTLDERVYEVVRRIPRGRVSTYGAVARAMDLRDVRRVGWALSRLGKGPDVPWHRVVNARGRISPRGDGTSVRIQRAALEAEGVRFETDGAVDLERWGWEAPSAPRD